MSEKAKPRLTPDRDSKYMGLAWIHAGFSKDPNTQVGAQLVSVDNFPLGSGYNGPPRIMPDDEVIWSRPDKNNPDAISKYDLIRHAEVNAIKHSCGDLKEATLYVTALPCPACMLAISDEEIQRVVYFNFQSSKNSILQNAKWRDKSFDIARRGRIQLDEFEGNIGWIQDWVLNLKSLSVFET